LAGLRVKGLVRQHGAGGAAPSAPPVGTCRAGWPDPSGSARPVACGRVSACAGPRKHHTARWHTARLLHVSCSVPVEASEADDADRSTARAASSSIGRSRRKGAGQARVRTTRCAPGDAGTFRATRPCHRLPRGHASPRLTDLPGTGLSAEFQTATRIFRHQVACRRAQGDRGRGVAAGMTRISPGAELPTTVTVHKAP